MAAIREGEPLVEKVTSSAEEIVGLLETHADTVWRICLVMMRNVYDAEDAFQATFLKLCEARPLFNDSEHAKAWLITAARNECRNRLKSFWHKNVRLTDGILPGDAPAPDRDLLGAVLSLPDRYRVLFYLHYYEGYSLHELSGMLGNESTIRTRLMRARGILKDSLLF